jgi:ParB family chromosome partitioning protein
MIPIDEIEITNRLREIDDDEANRIGASIHENGQITPIMVALIYGENELRPDGHRYRLIAGAHRVEGARRFNVKHLRAVVIEGSEDELRLREIDENLYRHELTPYDIAVFLSERRKVWTRIHGPVRRGGDRRSKGQICPFDGEQDGSRFWKETASQFKLHPKAVQRALKRKNGIAPEVWDALKGTSASKNASVLDAIVRLGRDKQGDLLRKVKEARVSFEAAVKLCGSKEVAASVTFPNLEAVKKAWGKAENAERLAIVAFIRAETKKQGGK